MKKLSFTIALLASTFISLAQQTFPVNGSVDPRSGQYAFINAHIVINSEQSIEKGTLLIKNQHIQSVAANGDVPKGYVVIDLKGKYIYPSFIDAFSTYGLPEPSRNSSGSNFGQGRRSVFTSTKKGAYNWNEAIRPETEVRNLFSIDSKKADELRKIGFGAVNSVNRDGIARGTSAALSLNDDYEHKVFLNDRAAANYSFSKGTSANDYPTSLMGSIALLRQTYLDAAWYKNQKEEYNLSLQAFNEQQNLPQLFEAEGWANILRVGKIGKEFGKNFIIKSNGNEYQRIDAVKATATSLIIPLNFPKAFDVEDPVDTKSISIAQLKHWEMAPGNPSALEKAGINFALTSFGLDNSRDFWSNLRLAIDRGLSEKQALRSCTEVPASLLGISQKLGSLEKGKLANFLICSTNIFQPNAIIYENWVQGKPYVINQIDVNDIRGNYELQIEGRGTYTLKLSGSLSKPSASIIAKGADSLKSSANFNRNGDWLSLSFMANKENFRLSGYLNQAQSLSMQGICATPNGQELKWTARFLSEYKEPDKKSEQKKSIEQNDELIFPFQAFGHKVAPKAESIIFKNATVWTNEKEGVLKNTDLWLENGKIKALGKNLSAPNAKIIDASNKHLTAGIIDEHSHIAASGGINEGAQAVSSEVRIGDILNSEDINIYRQLAGGVTSSQILHGSANPIGGQAQLIKLRWGALPEELKFAGADPFIKFALGENVKQSNFGTGQRFPVTRMGVEQTFVDAFTRAKDYEKALKVKGNNVRRDLELDALVEILNQKRFITCHSYVQSEINMLMHVADSLGFKINTFTHILEGYKVADKMKARNIAGSTFSDWWAYKIEVAEAIPYNGKIMHNVGITTAFNSDDAEMARRLNQEAGKAVLYGGVAEEEALKFVTLNPAKMLHIDDKVGSLKVGKDADVVLWSDHPLSIYAKAEKTFVDGICYWDIQKNEQLLQEQQQEKARLIQKMLDSKNKGSQTQRPSFQRTTLYNCESLSDYSGGLDNIEQNQGGHHHE